MSVSGCVVWIAWPSGLRHWIKAREQLSIKEGGEGEEGKREEKRKGKKKSRMGFELAAVGMLS